MTLFLAIPVMIAVGWIVPRAVVRRLASGWAVVWGSLAALALGAALVWGGAHLAEMLAGVDARTEAESALNAWKILLLLAPAAALDARRRQTRNGDD